MKIAWLLSLLAAFNATAGEIQLHSPRDYQVFQRSTTDSGTISIAGSLVQPTSKDSLVEARLASTGPWQEIAQLDAGQSAITAKLAAPAGGWYPVDVRVTTADGTVIAQSLVGHVGVGEIFIIAGQSNSANHGEEKQRTQSAKVSVFDGKVWHFANDPQPGASGNGGSFIPHFGDAIAEKFHVPVGIVAAGVGATSVREWLPKGASFPNPPTLLGNVREGTNGAWESKGNVFESFSARVKPLGKDGFRAVLWHQGESDANQQDPSRTLPGTLYSEYLTTLIRETRQAAGWDCPWFVAQASYHTPDDPGSPDIRAAQKALWENGVALQGPDTDALTGSLRDSDGKGVHFSGPGLRAHAATWFDKVAPWLEKQLNARKAD